MIIDLISSVPELLSGPLEYSIIGKARSSGLVEIRTHDLREYSKNKHRKVDDYPFGGGAGMVMTAQPVFDCLEALQKNSNIDAVLFPSPDAEVLNQKKVNRISLYQHIVILCGHYKGVDQRIRDMLVTQEYSLGDYVLSGGELPAMVLIDSVVRLLPGAIGDSESALDDSFQDGLLSAPVYTRPANFRGHIVPEELLSGDHKRIRQWREKQSLERTRLRRPDLYQRYINKK